jgi:hypothetical protein
MTSRSSPDTYIVMEFAIIFVGVFLVFQIILFEHGEHVLYLIKFNFSKIRKYIFDVDNKLKIDRRDYKTSTLLSFLYDDEQEQSYFDKMSINNFIMLMRSRSFP